MRSGRNLPRKVLVALVLAGVGTTSLSVPAMAQDDSARLRRIESELRALQRAVFPNSDGRFFTPEVSATDNAQPQQQIGTPSSTALSDMLLRLNSLEGEIARLTAASEENSAKMQEIENRLAALEQGGAAAGALPAGPLPSGAVNSGAATNRPATGIIQPPGETRPPAQAASAPSAPAPAATNAAPTPQRVAAVQAITKPATDDAGDDEYVYGFRLWEAGLYPEARQQLERFVEQYPSHWRTSYGRNLLGRAFLDDGDPRGAATHFLSNYQADKGAARAGDSLLYLADAMIAMGDTNRACIALATFGDEYPALAAGRLKDQYDRNRGRVTCN